MTSEHTPTEGQMLTAWLIAEGATRMPARHQGRFKAEFDRFIASVKAEGAVQELRDVADELEQQGVEPWDRNAGAIRALRFRADLIEDGGL